MNVRFEVERNPEPDDNAHLYFVTVFDADTGEELERHHCEDGYGFVGAWREQEAMLAAHPGKYLLEIEADGLPW